MEMSTSNEVKLTLCLRNGQQVEFVKPCGNTNGDVDFGTLHKALCSVQQESNAFLTTVVEEEKAASTTNGQKSSTNVDEDDEDDDGDDEEEDGNSDASLNGPVEKKPKL